MTTKRTTICANCGAPIEERVFQRMDYIGLYWAHVGKDELEQFCDELDLDAYLEDEVEVDQPDGNAFYTGPRFRIDPKEEFMIRRKMRTATPA